MWRNLGVISCLCGAFGFSSGSFATGKGEVFLCCVVSFELAKHCPRRYGLVYWREEKFWPIVVSGINALRFTLSYVFYLCSGPPHSNASRYSAVNSILFRQKSRKLIILYSSTHIMMWMLTTAVSIGSISSISLSLSTLNLVLFPHLAGVSSFLCGAYLIVGLMDIFGMLSISVVRILTAFARHSLILMFALATSYFHPHLLLSRYFFCAGGYSSRGGRCADILHLRGTSELCPW